MSQISKSFIIASAIAFISAFMPLEYTQAAIFDGSSDADSNRFGICLSEDSRTDVNHPDYATCKDVNCGDPQDSAQETYCTSEAQAGTKFAKDSLSDSGITHTDNFGDFVIKLVNFSLPYLTLAAFLAYVVAGFLYVTALGNDEQMQKAKKIIVWASVGLLLVMMSYSITNVLTSQLVIGLGAS